MMRRTLSREPKVRQHPRRKLAPIICRRIKKAAKGAEAVEGAEGADYWQFGPIRIHQEYSLEYIFLDEKKTF